MTPYWPNLPGGRIVMPLLRALHNIFIDLRTPNGSRLKYILKATIHLVGSIILNTPVTKANSSSLLQR